MTTRSTTTRLLRISTVAALLATLFSVAGPTPAGAAAGFGDVPDGAFYTAPVQWMVDNEITNGTSAGCFSPDRELTRGELAVFLWRYAGEPAGGSELFADVGASDFFAEAVAWMVNNDITTGTTDTTFEPDRTVTRAEVATFIWRFMGEPNGGSEPFTDVPPGEFYSEAVAWMSNNDITTGTSATTFHPFRAVTRAEIATFLWRLAGEPVTTIVPGGTCGPTGPGGGSGGGSGTFETLPVGAELPSGEWCATQVRSAAETRPGNAAPNATRGSGSHPDYPRVDGDFVGSTDEILQWAACKWGIDEDIVRAQAVKESYWHMGVRGDRTGQFACHPDVAGDIDHTGNCPESVGILQVRFPFHQDAFPSALYSTAYNADYTYAIWRACYEGAFTWLGGGYAAGDLDGCLGFWFSGQWYSSNALWYIDELYDILNDRTWESDSFRAHEL